MNGVWGWWGSFQALVPREYAEPRGCPCAGMARTLAPGKVPPNGWRWNRAGVPLPGVLKFHCAKQACICPHTGRVPHTEFLTKNVSNKHCEITLFLRKSTQKKEWFLRASHQWL